MLASGVLLGSTLAAGLAVVHPVAADDSEGGSTPATGAAAATAATGTLTALFAPSTVCATGAAQSFTLTVTVTGLPNSRALKTLFVTVPTGYSVSGVTASPGTASVLTGAPAYIRVGGLNLSSTAGSNSVTVKFSSTTPAGIASWLLEGETGNDRRPDNDTATPNGDDFTAATLPTTTVAVCHLAFMAGPTPAGPADAGATKNITSVPLTETGTPPVTVEILDASNAVVAVTNGITLSLNTISVDPPKSSAALTVGPPLPSTISGVATFTTLSIDNPGRYTLTANSDAGITSVTSSPFRIWGATQPCAGSCNAPLSTGGENFNVGSSSTSGAIGASAGIVTFDCADPSFGGVPGITGTYTVTWTSYSVNAGKTITFVIPNTVLKAASPSYLAIHYMVCVSAPYSFKTAWTPTGLATASSDTQVSKVMGGTWYRGLLPDCQDVVPNPPGGPTTGNPCVQSRVDDGTNLTVTVSAASGDPMGR